jgi:hypothetical protein
MANTPNDAPEGSNATQSEVELASLLAQATRSSSEILKCVSVLTDSLDLKPSAELEVKKALVKAYDNLRTQSLLLETLVDRLARQSSVTLGNGGSQS